MRLGFSNHKIERLDIEGDHKDGKGYVSFPKIEKMKKDFNYEDGYRFLRDFLELGGLDIVRAFENLEEIGEDYYYIIDAIQEYVSCCGADGRMNLKGIDLNSFLYEKVLQDASRECSELLKDNNFDLRDYIYVYANYLATCYETGHVELIKEKIEEINLSPNEFPKKLKFVLRELDII